MKAFVVPNYQKTDTTNILESLVTLSEKYGLDLCLTSAEDNKLAFPNITKQQIEQLAGCDIIIAIGGDGTIMHCSRLSALCDKPIMGINAGKLGFLAQVEPQSLDSYLRRLTTGDYNVEYRSAISASFEPNLYPPLDFALNDIVVSKAPEYNIARFEMSCSGKEIDCYRADGLIFSTSTGSTAYNLSAGGPVIDPQLGVITLAPICPHSMSARSMVFSQQRVITVCSPETPLIVIADGSQRRTVAAGTVISITTAASQAGFISFHEREFFEILTTKIKQRG